MSFPRGSALWKFLLFGGLLAGAVCWLRFTQTGRQITPSAIRTYLESHGPLAARALYVGLYAIGSVVMLPGVAMSFAGAVLFGMWEGTLWTWIGATIGACLAFFVARGLGREFIDQLLAGRFEELARRLQSHGFVGLLLLRLTPIFPFNALNFGAGLTAINFRHYFWATAIGILPGTLVYQYLFVTLQERIFTEGFSWNDLADLRLWSALAAFAAFAVAGGRLAKWLNARRTGEFQEREGSKAGERK